MVFSSTIIANAEKEADKRNDFLNTSPQLRNNIELDGTCNMFFHFLYRTRQNTIINPTEDIVKTAFSIIVFQHSEISINGEQIGNNESGVLFLFHFKGDYDLNYENHLLTLNGKAWSTFIPFDNNLNYSCYEMEEQS